jgi:hypothetical protein
MDPNEISLENLNKSFEYCKIAAEIDKIDSIEDLKVLAKSYIKLYFKQQEVLSDLGQKIPKL